MTRNAASVGRRGELHRPCSTRCSCSCSAGIVPGLEVRPPSIPPDPEDSPTRDGLAPPAAWPIDWASSPPRAGEAIAPQIRFEQPWSQWSRSWWCSAAPALIIWLYRREGQASLALQVGPGRAPDLPGPADDLHALRGRPLGRADRACPTSSSWSTTRPASRSPTSTSNPKTQGPAEALGRAGRRSPRRRPDRPGEAARLAIAKGLILRDDGRLLRELAEAAQGPALPRLELGRGCWPRSTSPRTSTGAARSSREVEATGGQTRLGDGVRQVLTELRGVPPSAILLLTDGQTTDGEPLAKAAELAARKGVPLYTVGLGSPEPARDLELTELLVDDVVFVDDLVRFQAKLLARGFAGPEGRRPAQGARRRSAPTPKPTASSRSIRGRRPRPTASRSGSRSVTGPRQTGERHLHPRGRAPAPRAPGREQPDRAHRQRPQGEAQGPARRQRAPLRVPLPQELPGARGDDRPERRPALVRPRVQRAGPLGPAHLPGRQGRAVRLRRGPPRRRRPELPEPVADAEPRRVRHREGGRPPVHRGRAVQPAALPGDAAGDAPADRAGRGPQPDRRGQRDRVVPARADRRGAVEPDLPVRRRRGGQRPDLAEPARALLVPRGAPQEARRRWCWPSTRPSTGSDGKLPIYPLPVRRRGQGDVQRRSTTPGGGGSASATATSAGSGSRRSGSWPGRSWSASSRPRSRPTAAATSGTSRSRSGSGSPTPGSRPPGGEVVVQVERKGQGPRKLTLKPGRRARATSSRGPCRRRPRGSTRSACCRRRCSTGRSRRPTFRVDAPAGEFERVQMNEPELIRAADADRRASSTRPLTADDPAEGPAQAAEGSARHRPADPALEHLAGPGAVPGTDHGGMGFQKTKQMV